TLIGSLIFGTLVVPGATSAQPARKVFRIGILTPGMTSAMVGPQPRGHFTGALLRGLRQLGYVYGEHFVTEPRGAGGRPERYSALATELVRLQVDLIVLAGHTPATQAAKGDFDDPDRHGWRRRPGGARARPESRPPWRELHGVEPSGRRDD